MYSRLWGDAAHSHIPWSRMGVLAGKWSDLGLEKYAIKTSILEINLYLQKL